MDNEGKGCLKSLCTTSGIAKFCLTYFTTLLILTLIFIAINHEESATESKWWWLFVGALIGTAAMSTTTLVALVLHDYTKSPEPNQMEPESTGIIVKSPIDNAPSHSASFKTILTINSQPTERSVKANAFGAGAFPDLTNRTMKPLERNPITVIDMSTLRKEKGGSPDKTVESVRKGAGGAAVPGQVILEKLPTKTATDMPEPSNLGAVPSTALVEAKKKAKKGKHKKHKHRTKKKKKDQKDQKSKIKDQKSKIKDHKKDDVKKDDARKEDTRRDDTRRDDTKQDDERF